MSTVWDRAVDIVMHRKTCTHEAGHAAAALVLGIEPTRIYAKRLDEVDKENLHQPIGMVEVPPLLRHDFESLRERALIALLGRIYEGEPNWPPKWPLSFAPVTSDEKDLGELVKAIGLDEQGYEQLVRDAYALASNPRFERAALAVGELLERGYDLDTKAITTVKRIADDDADRDELGVISDAQVEKDIEQLRRQQAEEAEVVLASPKGDGPAKGVDEDWGESVFKSLRSVMARAEHERELRDLRRRCDEVAHEVAIADAQRVHRDAHNASGRS